MATNASSFLKRGSPSCWPDELTVINDPNHALFDERLALPVTDERIRNLVAVGQVQPIAVRVEGNELVVTAGRQRWKMATVINHLVGVRMYKGKIESIWDAIERLKRTPLASWIADQVPNGMKLQFVVYRGDAMEAGRASTSENEMRVDDPRDAKIRRAQRMAKQGHSAEDIADAFGFGVDAAAVAKVKRWLKVDLDRPQEKKPRPKSTRPSKSTVNDVVIALGDPRVGTLLCWVRGESTAEQVLEFYPELAEALGATKKAEAA
jgi:hypothetical protein